MRKFRWALKATKTGELFTHSGRIVVHDNPKELRWLFLKSIETGKFTVEELPKTGEIGRPLLRLQHHPDMETVRWPLRRSDFVDGR